MRCRLRPWAGFVITVMGLALIMPTAQALAHGHNRVGFFVGTGLHPHPFRRHGLGHAGVVGHPHVVRHGHAIVGHHVGPVLVVQPPSVIVVTPPAVVVHTWVPGHWEWTGSTWAWIPGHRQ